MGHKLNCFLPSESLVLDTDVITYPNKDITTAGTEAIMRFFCSGKQNHPLPRHAIICHKLTFYTGCLTISVTWEYNSVNFGSFLRHPVPRIVSLLSSDTRIIFVFKPWS